MLRDCLRSLGVAVVEVPPAPELPDAVFVEDTAVVLDEVAVVTRPGPESRRPETAAVAEALRRYKPVEHISAPGTLDGGDVLRLGRILYVGRSRRTDETGIAGLREIVEPLGYHIGIVPVERCLHLLSACSAVGDEVLLVNPALVDPTRFDGVQLIEVPADETAAANTLRIGNTVVMARGYPETRHRLEAAGIELRVVDISEFEKAEGGVSCLTLLVP